MTRNCKRTYEDVRYGPLLSLLKQIFLESGTILPFVEPA